MNQMWVRISLTYMVIVIFLFLIPSVVYLTIQADEISLGVIEAEGLDNSNISSEPATLYDRMINTPHMSLVRSLFRILLSISMVGILVGVISSRGLAAPLHNLAEAAKAIGSQDLSQRIDIKGTEEVREVAIAFNAMAEALEEAEGIRNNMLADIAHELRTPLTVIQGNLRAILDDVYELDKIEVARLYDQTRQLSRLVDDLHDLALLEANQFSLDLNDLDLIDVVHDVSAIYLPILEDQELTLSIVIPDTIPVVQGDCARITQCINNLLNNSIRHTAGGGKITIHLSAEEDSARLTIKDTGIGLDPEHLPFVFDRFYRVDQDRNRRTGGSGLGLAITQALVLAHGGEISAASEGKNLGSEFTIQLPFLT